MYNLFNIYNLYVILTIMGIYFKNSFSENNTLIKQKSKDNITYDMQEEFFSHCTF